MGCGRVCEGHLEAHLLSKRDVELKSYTLGSRHRRHTPRLSTANHTRNPSSVPIPRLVQKLFTRKPAAHRKCQVVNPNEKKVLLRQKRVDCKKKEKRNIGSISQLLSI